MVGLNTACLQRHSDLKPIDLLEITLKNNFSAIEFRDEYPFFQSLTDKQIIEISSIIKNESLFCSIHLGFYNQNIGALKNSIRQAAVDDHSRSIEIAAALGVSNLTIHGGTLNLSYYSGQYFQEVENNTLNSIRYLAKKCAAYNIKLSVENLSTFEKKTYKCYNTPNALNQLCKTVDNVGMTIDFGHIVSVQKSVTDFFNKLDEEKICLAHMSDNDFLSDLHLATGDGKIDFPSFIKMYKSRKWNFPLMIETKTFENALKSQKYLNELLLKEF